VISTKRFVISVVALTGLSGLLLFSGCAKKDNVQPETTPTPVINAGGEPTPVPSLPTPEPTPSRSHYVVQPGDSLWKISGEEKVLNDSFRWPLLFKSNRDQILDPDLIEPAQDLSYEGSYSQTEIDEAVSKLKETPPYKPHTAPRKQLPVKY